MFIKKECTFTPTRIIEDSYESTKMKNYGRSTAGGQEMFPFSIAET